MTEPRRPALTSTMRTGPDPKRDVTPPATVRIAGTRLCVTDRGNARRSVDSGSYVGLGCASVHSSVAGLLQGAVGPLGIVTVCYARSTGALRVIDAEAGRRCTSAEKRFTFNRTGPAGRRGARGSAGATGTKGDPGLQGPAGVNGATNARVRSAYVTIAPGATGGGLWDFLPGETATGGGGSGGGGEITLNLPHSRIDNAESHENHRGLGVY
jgi:hypothetical protein